MRGFAFEQYAISKIAAKSTFILQSVLEPVRDVVVKYFDGDFPVATKLVLGTLTVLQCYTFPARGIRHILVE